MKGLVIIFPVLMLIVGIFLMFWTTQINRNLLHGDEASLGKYFMGAALFGLWVFLVSVGGILAIGLLSGADGWTVYQTLEIIILGLVAAIVGTLGSLWQFFIATRFRKSLDELLKRKNR